jgi:hypothetical protein
MTTAVANGTLESQFLNRSGRLFAFTLGDTNPGVHHMTDAPFECTLFPRQARTSVPASAELLPRT